MQKKHFPTLYTFSAIRRGDWKFKVSVFSDKCLLLVAYHEYDCVVHVKYFTKPQPASDYIDMLVNNQS